MRIFTREIPAALILFCSPLVFISSAHAGPTVLQRAIQLHAQAYEEGAHILDTAVRAAPKGALPANLRAYSAMGERDIAIANDLQEAVDFLRSAEEAYQHIREISQDEEKNFFEKKHWLCISQYSYAFRNTVSELRGPKESIADVITRIHTENLSGMGGLADIQDFNAATGFYLRVNEACRPH